MSNYKTNASRKYSVLFTLMILSVLSMFIWCAARTVNAIQFKMNCEQYIKRAADASSIDIAKKEIEHVLAYCEENGLTEGVVSIFFKQPVNDVGFWYNNLKTAHEEMENLPEDASTLEETNLLMKIRETLVDSDENGTDITIPDGISIYPNNSLYFWWIIISFVVCTYAFCASIKY